MLPDVLVERDDRGRQPAQKKKQIDNGCAGQGQKNDDGHTKQRDGDGGNCIAEADPAVAQQHRTVQQIGYPRRQHLHTRQDRVERRGKPVAYCRRRHAEQHQMPFKGGLGGNGVVKKRLCADGSDRTALAVIIERLLPVQIQRLHPSANPDAFGRNRRRRAQELADSQHAKRRGKALSGLENERNMARCATGIGRDVDKPYAGNFRKSLIGAQFGFWGGHQNLGGLFKRKLTPGRNDRGQRGECFCQTGVGRLIRFANQQDVDRQSLRAGVPYPFNKRCQKISADRILPHSRDGLVVNGHDDHVPRRFTRTLYQDAKIQKHRLQTVQHACPSGDMALRQRACPDDTCQHHQGHETGVELQLH